MGLVTAEALAQLTRGNDERFSMAEEAAEASMIEYLTNNYEIEAELEVGKLIQDYNHQINYPVDGCFYDDAGRICKAIRVIGGRIRPFISPYWAVSDKSDEGVEPYRQLTDYYPGTLVKFANSVWECLIPNGPVFNDIRVPGLEGWAEAPNSPWLANNPYALWNVVSFNDNFYTLIELPDDPDWTVNPEESDMWGLIADYDEEYNRYELSDHEYVVYEGRVMYPTIEVNSPDIKENYNIIYSDPRNANVKKHMLRMAVYELHKLISPNNVSQARITDYETTIVWLRDASRLKINPQIPRKIDPMDNKPVTDYAMATYARDFDPYKDPWLI